MEVTESNNIVLRDNHYYYGHVQFQLGVSCQSWYDFVLYPNIGLVVDRMGK